MFVPKFWLSCAIHRFPTECVRTLWFYLWVKTLVCRRLCGIHWLSYLTFPFELPLLSPPASVATSIFRFQHWVSCRWCDNWQKILLRNGVNCAIIRVPDSHLSLAAGCRGLIVQITTIVPKFSEFYQHSLDATPTTLTIFHAIAEPKVQRVPFLPRVLSSIFSNDLRGQPTVTGSSSTSYSALKLADFTQKSSSFVIWACSDFIIIFFLPLTALLSACPLTIRKDIILRVAALLAKVDIFRIIVPWEWCACFHFVFEEFIIHVLQILQPIKVPRTLPPIVLCSFGVKIFVRGVWRVLLLNDLCLSASYADLVDRFVTNICFFPANHLLHLHCSGLFSTVKPLFHLSKPAKTTFSSSCLKG